MPLRCWIPVRLFPSRLTLFGAAACAMLAGASITAFSQSSSSNPSSASTPSSTSIPSSAPQQSSAPGSSSQKSSSSQQAGSAAAGTGQNASGGNGSQPAFTFQANTRVVLTDVTVADANGNPVKGLPQPAFRILDNKKPQAIASFEEHAGAVAAATETPAAEHGVYSNDYLLHLPDALNVLVIDIANLRMEDQMYLNYQMTRFLNHLPEGQLMAIYLHSDGLFMVQNFTTDRALLLAGVHRAIPRFQPFGRQYLTDQRTLMQIANDLHNLPGRKNVLWFSGGSSAYSILDPGAWANRGDLRAVYDELDTDRIAIYPIDARGLTGNAAPQVLTAQAFQHSAMQEAAQATGGHAYFNTNGLDLAAARVIDTDANFYTVTYSPNNFRYDNKWHKVEIDVASGQKLALGYRHGYYADGSIGTAADAEEKKTRTRLMAGGETMEEKTETAPIIFQAMVLPASDPALTKLPRATGRVETEIPAKNTIPYSVRYSIPASALTEVNADDRRKYTFGLAAIALDHEGNPVKREMKQVTVSFNEEELEKHRSAPIAIDEALYLKKGDEYLVLAVWDATSKRMGMVQVPLKGRD